MFKIKNMLLPFAIQMIFPQNLENGVKNLILMKTPSIEFFLKYVVGVKLF